MINLTKKIALILVIPAVFIGSIYAFYYFGYNWYHNKIYPYDYLKISQESSGTIKIDAFSAFTIKKPSIQQIDHNNKIIIFSLLDGDDNSGNIQTKLPINGLIGYNMCYYNKYGNYCFGKIK